MIGRTAKMLRRKAREILPGYPRLTEKFIYKQLKRAYTTNVAITKRNS